MESISNNINTNIITPSSKKSFHSLKESIFRKSSIFIKNFQIPSKLKISAPPLRKIRRKIFSNMCSKYDFTWNTFYTNIINQILRNKTTPNIRYKERLIEIDRKEFLKKNYKQSEILCKLSLIITILSFLFKHFPNYLPWFTHYSIIQCNILQKQNLINKHYNQLVKEYTLKKPWSDTINLHLFDSEFEESSVLEEFSRLYNNIYYSDKIIQDDSIGSVENLIKYVDHIEKGYDEAFNGCWVSPKKMKSKFRRASNMFQWIKKISNFDLEFDWDVNNMSNCKKQWNWELDKLKTMKKGRFGIEGWLRNMNSDTNIKEIKNKRIISDNIHSIHSSEGRWHFNSSYHIKNESATDHVTIGNSSQKMKWIKRNHNNGKNDFMMIKTKWAWRHSNKKKKNKWSVMTTNSNKDGASNITHSHVSYINNNDIDKEVNSVNFNNNTKEKAEKWISKFAKTSKFITQLKMKNKLKITKSNYLKSSFSLINSIEDKKEEEYLKKRQLMESTLQRRWNNNYNNNKQIFNIKSLTSKKIFSWTNHNSLSKTKIPLIVLPERHRNIKANTTTNTNGNMHIYNNSVGETRKKMKQDWKKNETLKLNCNYLGTISPIKFEM